MSPSLTEDQAATLAAAVGTAFSPRTPVSNRELFAGRWDQITQIGDTVAQTGLHAVIFGERGVGKTSLTHVIRPLLNVIDREATASEGESQRIVVRVNADGTDLFSSLWKKALDEIYWSEDRPHIGFNPSSGKEQVTLLNTFGVKGRLTIDTIRRILSPLVGSVFIFDEFDRLPKDQVVPFTDLIKALSDSATQTTIVLVGVSDTVNELLEDHASIGRALIQIPMPRMSEDELGEIISNAEEALGIAFENSAKEQIVRMSQGLPHFTHLLGFHAVRSAGTRRSGEVNIQDVRNSFGSAVRESDQTVINAYAHAIQSAQPGAKYPQVILAAAIAAYVSSDELGYFQPANLVEPMSAIMERHEDISRFNQHLSQFTEEKRGFALERTGSQRAYRYRFSHPILPTYVLMRSINDGLIPEAVVDRLLRNA